MRPITKTEMLIYQPKTNLEEKAILIKSFILKTRKSKIPVRGLYGNGKFHVPFKSMIYFVSTFEFNAIVSFMKVILISIATESWTRTECGILSTHACPLQTLF